MIKIEDLVWVPFCYWVVQFILGFYRKREKPFMRAQQLKSCILPGTKISFWVWPITHKKWLSFVKKFKYKSKNIQNLITRWVFLCMTQTTKQIQRARVQTSTVSKQGLLRIFSFNYKLKWKVKECRKQARMLSILCKEISFSFSFSENDREGKDKTFMHTEMSNQNQI